MLASRLARPATTKRMPKSVSASRSPPLIPSSIANFARRGGISAVTVAATSETIARSVRAPDTAPSAGRASRRAGPSGPTTSRSPRPRAASSGATRPARPSRPPPPDRAGALRSRHAREEGGPPPQPDGLEPTAEVRARGRRKRAESVPTRPAAGPAFHVDAAAHHSCPRARHAPAASTRSANSRSRRPCS